MLSRTPSEINPTLKCPSDPNNPKCETTEEPQTGNTAILNIAKWINISILTLAVIVLFY